MKKFFIFALAFFMVTGFALAQSPEQAPDTTPGEMPDNLTGVLPDLPGQASNVAEQVRNSISNAFSNGLEGVRGLGESLSGLLGGGDLAPGNETGNGNAENV